jgi:putative DNA methylase
MTLPSPRTIPRAEGACPAPLLGERTLLEEGFPFRDVSAVALADRHSRDRIYAAHKWWARRPPAVIRALLIAASLPANTSSEVFWAAYADDEPRLAGHHVGDPFMGGATTIVEAARLGAQVTGIDVDPLSVRVASQELQGANAEQLKVAGDELLTHLDTEVGALFGQVADGPAPLHFFFLREVACPACADRALLYRDLVLARGADKAGGVVRTVAVTAFCPDCRSVHELEDLEDLTCCGRTRHVAEGTFADGRFSCSACAATATHQTLRTASAPRLLIGVEELDGRARRIRAAQNGEDGIALAADWWCGREFATPVTPLGAGETARARNYGFERVRDLFSARQLAFFVAAFDHIDNADLDSTVRDGLRLATSNALASNNLLCGYAPAYGRLAPLFMGVRAYSMPVMSVELNPLQRRAGRGTLAAMIRRVAATDVTTVRRHAFDPATNDTVRHDFKARGDGVVAKLACRSAERGLPDDLGPLTLALSDPPYFDYISYSDLSLFFRAWHGDGTRAERLGGAPIFPVGPDAATTFRDRIALAFGKVRERLAAGALFCFTFHATSTVAWEALAEGITKANLRVITVFPVWADARAASHSHDGNCEWDLVFVCRPKAEAPKNIALPETIDTWLDQLDGTPIRDADKRNMKLGLQCARAAGEEGQG